MIKIWYNIFFFYFVCQWPWLLPLTHTTTLYNCKYLTNNEQKKLTVCQLDCIVDEELEIYVKDGAYVCVSVCYFILNTTELHMKKKTEHRQKKCMCIFYFYCKVNRFLSNNRTILKKERKKNCFVQSHMWILIIQNLSIFVCFKPIILQFDFFLAPIYLLQFFFSWKFIDKILVYEMTSIINIEGKIIIADGLFHLFVS